MKRKLIDFCFEKVDEDEIIVKVTPAKDQVKLHEAILKLECTETDPLTNVTYIITTFVVKVIPNELLN